MFDKPPSYTEIAEQPYQGARLSAGLVYDHPADAVYLKLERGGDETMILLRMDEALAIIHVLSGALWSLSMLTPQGV